MRDTTTQPDLSSMERVDAEALNFAAPPLQVYPPAPNPFLRSPIPPSQWMQPDSLRQFYRTGHPQNRVAPLPGNANPYINAAAQGISTTTVENNSSKTVTTASSIAVNHQSGTSYNVQPGDLDTVVSMSNNSGGTVTLPSSVVNSQSFVQFGQANAVNPSSVTMTNAAGNMLLIVIKALTGTPTIADTKGNSYSVITTASDLGGGTTSLYYALNIKAGLNVITGGGGINSITNVIEYRNIFLTGALDKFTSASSVGSGSPTLTTGGPNCLAVYSNYSGGSLTTYAAGTGWAPRLADLQGLIEDQQYSAASSLVVPTYTGGTGTGGNCASVMATFFMTPVVSANAVPAGWFCYVENIGNGTFNVQSGAPIDGSLNPVGLSSNTGALFVYDGTSWTSVRGITGVLPHTFVAIAHQFLNSYTASTGLFTAAQPAFTDISGNIAVSQMNSGTGASSSTFWRGDGTWAGIPGEFNQSMLVDGVDMSDDYWISVDSGAYDQALPLVVT